MSEREDTSTPIADQEAKELREAVKLLYARGLLDDLERRRIAVGVTLLQLGACVAPPARAPPAPPRPRGPSWARRMLRAVRSRNRGGPDGA